MAISSVYQVTGSDADLVQTYSDLLSTYTLDLTSQYTDAQATINTSLTSAQVYATAALASENAAATSAAASASSASTSSTQATNAAASASTATTKASEAATSQTSAATSATNAANSLATFQGQYHGALSSAPTSNVDTGDLYFHTGQGVKVYDGSAWDDVKPTNAEQTNIDAVSSNASNISAAASNAANITTVAGKTSEITSVAAKASLITSDFVSDLNTLAVTDVINDINLLATSDVVSDMNVLGTADAVSDMNALAAISSDISSLSSALEKTYTITVVGGVFYLDGASKPTITLFRGNTYIFDQSDSSNANHPIAFRQSDDTSYTTGVVSTGTAGSSGAKTTFNVPSNAPNSLKYYCTVHGNSMGNTIAVTDSNISLVATNIANVNLTGGSITNVNNVGNSIANVNTAATALNEITSFNDLFSVSASAPSSPSAGDLWYDTTNSQLKVYVGSAFQLAGSYLQGLTTTHVFTATANQTTFTTDDASATMSIYANGNTLVFKNGIRLVEGSNSTNDYYISGNNVVLNAGASAGDVLYVEVFTKISTTQETSLNTLVTDATTQANNASTSAATSTTQATNSANSATASANSATASATSATASASSATASAGSATAAASSATSAAASFDDLDDRYLGAKSSAPTVDNDGDAIDTGALYWNTSTNKLFVWDGSAWQQGSFTAGALLANLLEDTSPQLGGSLDVVTHPIVSTSNRNIAITPNGTGSVVLDGLSYPQADGTAGQFMKTDGSGNLAFATVSTPTLSSLSLDNHDNLSVDGSGNVALGTSSISFGTSKWGIVLDGNDLDFQYNGTTVFKLASNGAVTSANDITAFGSP